jgi:hypothetical protein
MVRILDFKQMPYAIGWSEAKRSFIYFQFIFFLSDCFSSHLRAREFSFLKSDSLYVGNQPLSRARLAEEMVKRHAVLGTWHWHCCCSVLFCSFLLLLPDILCFFCITCLSVNISSVLVPIVLTRLELVAVIPLSYAKTQTAFSHVYTFYASVMIQLLSFRDVSVVTLVCGS